MSEGSGCGLEHLQELCRKATPTPSKSKVMLQPSLRDAEMCIGETKLRPE